jgi:prepilin signal peptidase PulO-like enzyme (type II secretory pathway)
LVTLFLACFFAIAGFIVLKILKKAADDNTVAFAPYLGIAAYLWMLAIILFGSRWLA